MKQVELKTPVQNDHRTDCFDGKKLRADSRSVARGNGLLDGVMELIPNARVGFVGLYPRSQDRCTLQITSRCPTLDRSDLVIAVDTRCCAPGNFVSGCELICSKSGGHQHSLLVPFCSARGHCPEKAARTPECSIVTATVE